MFGSQALETAIGLSLIFFVLASMASAIVESISQILRKRAADLEKALLAMLGDPAAPQQAAGNETATTPDPMARMRTTTVLAPVYKTMNAGWFQRSQGPAYMSARSFADAVVEMVANADDGTALAGAEGLRLRIRTLLAEANGDLLHVKAGLEGWFDETMARLADAYKRWATSALFVVGLLLAVAGNVSALDVARALWIQPVARQAALDAAQQVAATGASPTAVSDAARALPDLGLPLGWPSTLDWSGWAAVPHVIGWLITALLIMLGAPFWFDALSRLVSLRTAGAKPPPAADDDASATSQQSSTRPPADSAALLEKMRKAVDSPAAPGGPPAPGAATG